MTMRRPSAFEESPEELLARARDWQTEAHPPLDNTLLIRDLGKTLERQRELAARSTSIISDVEDRYRALEQRTVRLQRERWALFVITAIVIAFMVFVLLRCT